MEHIPGPSDSGDDVELLAVRVLVERRSLRLVLAGELDLGEVDNLRREVRRALQTWPCPAVLKLDLSHLRFIDVAGLRALAEACRALKRATSDFSVVGAPRHVRRAIEVSGVNVPGLIVTRQKRILGQQQIGEADAAESGLEKRSRTAVPLWPERSSTRSHS